ncbi:unnamed protein product [Caenorhabditis nigoni]
MAGKRFTLKYVFENVEKLEEEEELESPEEEHFGVNWKMVIAKNEEHLEIYLYANVTGNQKIHADYTMKIISKIKENTYLEHDSGVFENGQDGWDNWGFEFIDWKTLENQFLDDGKLEVEIHVKITRMVGFYSDPMTEREFTLKYVFENVGTLQDLYSPEEEHFGVKWTINIERRNKFLGMWLCANFTGNQEIHTYFTMKVFSKNKENNHSMSRSDVFKKRGGSWDMCGWYDSVEWETMKTECLDDGKLEVEIHVKITKMIGFPEEVIETSRKELRSFGEEMEQFSDVILKVEDRKFYVLKLYLSTHSPYFATLFLGKFRESEKSEIELKDVDSQDFQYYLEVLYGENGIDDQTVLGILSVADMFDTPLSVKKCEEFLVRESKLALKKKLELAGNYRLDKLKKMCLDQIKSKADIRSVIPKDPSEMDHGIMTELLKKSLACNCT